MHATGSVAMSSVPSTFSGPAKRLLSVFSFWIKRLPISSQCLVEPSKSQPEKLSLFVHEPFMGHLQWVRGHMRVKHRPSF